MPSVAEALARGDASAISTDVLSEWLASQRWFGAKSRSFSEFRVIECLPLRTEMPVMAILVVEARFGTGTHELYQVPVSVRAADVGDHPGTICATDQYIVYDALTDPEQAAVIAARLAAGAAGAGAGDDGGLTFKWDGALAPPSASPRVRSMGAEQSNSSIVFDERLVLKVFRRIESGINPELEMLRFLSSHGFENIAALAGWYGYEGELMDATLGVMQELVVPARDGWDLALDALEAADGGLLDRLAELGEVTGRMHAALASDSTDPDFAPERPSEENVALLTATIDEQIERLFVALPHEPALAPITGRGEELRDHLQMLSHTGIGGRLIRLHGDYHLGQIVYSAHGWVILDFEGEPGRPLLSRRRKRSPLRDVAGMLRSFAYAASAARLLRGVDAPDDWERHARERFLSGYLSTVDSTLLPAGQAAIHKLLSIFELEKAIYELRYEIDNRPEWIAVPVAGLVRLLENAP